MISERITDYIPPQIEILNMDALLQSRLKLEHCKLHKAARHPTKCDVINDVKLFPSVYCRIYCHKFLRLSNQMSHYKSKCIRIYNYLLLSFSLLAAVLIYVSHLVLSVSWAYF